MKASVIVFPGSNCDRDTKVALEAVCGQPVHMVWHNSHELPKCDLIVIPGGFSYGDYLRSGAMAAYSPIMRDVKEAANNGTLVLGICNGFQILTECGLLPGVLLPNVNLKFICRWTKIRIGNNESIFTNKFQIGQILKLPIAHNEGNYFADNETLNLLEGEGRIAMQYATKAGVPEAEINPNGSAKHIAGIFNKARTVLGMMPHPERAIDSHHESIDGKTMFEGIVGALS